MRSTGKREEGEQEGQRSNGKGGGADAGEGGRIEDGEGGEGPVEDGEVGKLRRDKDAEGTRSIRMDIMEEGTRAEHPY